MALMALVATASALDNGQGLVPPMGWNSVKAIGCGVNETIVLNNANALISLGLNSLGYTYANLDDCWTLPKRDANGHVVADPKRFPSGIPSLAQKVHNLGLKFGIQMAAGTSACTKGTGSLTYEGIDSADFAAWGVDYLKYSDCNGLGIPPETRFVAMRDALNKTGKGIYYSLARTDPLTVGTYGPSTANSWRTTQIKLRNGGWESVRAAFQRNNEFAAISKPGAWNDPDVLDIGTGWLSLTEEKTQFALFALAKAPLLLSCDITALTS